MPDMSRTRCSVLPTRRGIVRSRCSPRSRDHRNPAAMGPDFRRCQTSCDALQIFGAIQLAIINPMVADTAVTNAPQHTSTSTTGQVQCFKSDSEVSSNVA